MTDACADVEALHSAWIDGVLDPEADARVGAHVRDCPVCQHDVAALRRTRAMLRNLPARRLPADLDLLSRELPGGAEPRAAAGERAGGSRRQRVTTGVAVLAGLIGGAVFALGGQPAAEERLVTVPVDLFVADHLVHTVGGPVSTPVVVESRR